MAAMLPGCRRPYAAASPPAAAMMAIMTKVGLYVILRLSLLVLGPDAGPSAGFGAPALMIAGMLTMGFGTIGISGRGRSWPQGQLSGDHLVGDGARGNRLRAGGRWRADYGGALYYMIGSTAAIATFS